MAGYCKRETGLAGVDFSNFSTQTLKSLVSKILDNKIHGLAFSPYLEGQGPGTRLSEAQIRQKLAIIQPHVNWVRSFSCTEGNELIPRLAAESGLKSMVGVWLGDDLEKNELELVNGLQLARDGYADILAIGNEVLLRGDLSEYQLLDYINRAREGAPGVEIGYVDAYFEFEDHPRVTQACDVILADLYPFWEGCALEHSLLYMKDMYRRALKAGNGKRVIISETGWPNIGSNERNAVPSYLNAIKYLINTCVWAEEEGIELFYFSAFDEDWKVDVEGDVGASWGLWDKDGKPKYI